MALGCTVRELQERIDAQEFAEWWALHLIAPIGEERADLRAATIVQAAANPYAKEPLMITDCILPLPLYQDEPKQQEPAEIMSTLHAFTVAHGGDIK